LGLLAHALHRLALLGTGRRWRLPGCWLLHRRAAFVSCIGRESFPQLRYEPERI